jgi:predicted porin
VIGYSKVQDTAGGQILAFSNMPGVSDVTVNDAFDNLDGLGRLARLRYDSPDFAGFTLGASVGQKVVGGIVGGAQWDVAAKYADTLGDFQIKGAAAYSRLATDENRYSGSASVLHQPTGLNATIAGGHEDREGASDPNFVYAKLGYKARFLDLGVTAFSADIYSGRDFVTSGSDSLSFGFQAVQNLDYYRTELYFGVRLYEYDDKAASYKSGFAVLTGARIKF